MANVPQPSKNFIWVPPAFGGDEGGLTFLKRILQTAVTTGQPVIFGDGSRVFQYTHDAANYKKMFVENVVQLDNKPSQGIVAHRMDVDMGNYSIPLGLIELHRERKITEAQAWPDRTADWPGRAADKAAKLDKA